MIAMIIVPEKGSPGIVIPKAIAIMAPREAPEDTPRVEPSASGFLRSPCIDAPDKESAAPVSATQKTLGIRTGRRMLSKLPPSVVFFTAFIMTLKVSLSGIDTLPRHILSSIAAISNTEKNTYSAMVKPSRFFIIR